MKIPSLVAILGALALTSCGAIGKAIICSGSDNPYVGCKAEVAGGLTVLAVDLGTGVSRRDVPTLEALLADGSADAASWPARQRILDAAEAIASTAPDVVVVHDAGRWRVGEPGDAARAEVLNTTELLLDEAWRLGVEYEIAGGRVVFDAETRVELADGDARAVRLTAQHVLLVRRDSPIFVRGMGSGDLQAARTLADGTAMPGGWVSVDVQTATVPLRIVGTALDAYDAAVRWDQAAEILDGPAATIDGVVLAVAPLPVDDPVFDPFLEAGYAPAQEVLADEIALMVRTASPNEGR